MITAVLIHLHAKMQIFDLVINVLKLFDLKKLRGNSLRVTPKSEAAKVTKEPPVY